LLILVLFWLEVWQLQWLTLWTRCPAIAGCRYIDMTRIPAIVGWTH